MSWQHEKRKIASRNGAKKSQKIKNSHENFETLKNEVAFFVLRDDALLRAVFCLERS
jgi:hypothetical protein